MDQLCSLLAQAALPALGAGFGALTIISILFRRNRCLKRALVRLGAQRISDLNETWRIASTAYASGEPISLEDLLNKREADFALKSSKK